MDTQTTQPTSQTPQPSQPVQPAQPTPQPVKKSGNTFLKIVLILLGGCAVIFVVLAIAGGLLFKKVASSITEKGAEKFTENAIEKLVRQQTGSDVDVDLKNLDEGNFEITGEDGMSFSTSKELPKDFPNDVPIIKGAKITSSISSTDPKNGTQGMVASFTTTQDVDSVEQYYLDELATKGWDVTATYRASGDSSTISASKDSRFLIVAVAGGDSENTLTLTITSE